MSTEIWKAIEGYQGLYAVSDMGRVMRVSNRHGKPMNRVLKPIVNGAGYYRLSLCRAGRPRGFLVHTLVGRAFAGGSGNRFDHINRDKKDNRSVNLRRSTHSQNLANRTMQVNNKSGFKGVCRSDCKGSVRWRAGIQVNKRTIHLGVFASREVASQAYTSAAQKHFGEFASI